MNIQLTALTIRKSKKLRRFSKCFPNFWIFWKLWSSRGLRAVVNTFFDPSIHLPRGGLFKFENRLHGNMTNLKRLGGSGKHLFWPPITLAYGRGGCQGSLTLIPYPGAIFVRTILSSYLSIEISVRKIWENLTLIFSLFRLLFCKKNILNFLEILT